jgi:hypothetical protein
VAIGDSLRDTLGVVQPIRVLVRNNQGAILEDAPVRFLYVQSARDSALEVDSTTGVVFAARRTGSGETQIAARLGTAFQVLIPIRVTNAPDTAFAVRDTVLNTTVPDTGRVGAERNSVPVQMQVQYEDEAETLRGVADWLVRFAVVEPANEQNDSTRAVFLVNENYRPARLDTTASSGLATVRLRARLEQLFVPGSGVTSDTILVEAVAWRRGVPIKGTPDTIRVIVRAPSLPTP